MKTSLFIFVSLFSLGIFLTGCDSDKSNTFGTITVGNPGTKSHESALGFQIQYSERLSFKENVEEGFLQIDNSELIQSPAQTLELNVTALNPQNIEARLSFLRVEALQSPADSEKSVESRNELEAFVQDLFPGQSLRQKDWPEIGAIAFQVKHDESRQEEKRDEFVLLKDKTLLHLQVRAYAEAEGISLIGEAYRSTQFQKGSSGLGKMSERAEEPEVVIIQQQASLFFEWPEHFMMPTEDFEISLWADRIINLQNANYQNLTGGISLGIPSTTYHPDYDFAPISVDLGEQLPPGEFYISQIVLESASERVVLSPAPQLGVYILRSSSSEDSLITQMPLIRIQNEIIPSAPRNLGL